MKLWTIRKHCCLTELMFSCIRLTTTRKNEQAFNGFTGNDRCTEENRIRKGTHGYEMLGVGSSGRWNIQEGHLSRILYGMGDLYPGVLREGDQGGGPSKCGFWVRNKFNMFRRWEKGLQRNEQEDGGAERSVSEIGISQICRALQAGIKEVGMDSQWQEALTIRSNHALSYHWLLCRPDPSFFFLSLTYTCSRQHLLSLPNLLGTEPSADGTGRWLWPT